MWRVTGAALCTFLCTKVAIADPDRPLVEWSTWFRLGYGGSSEVRSATPGQRTQPTSPVHDLEASWETALGGDVTLPIARGGDLRAGAWAEMRTSSLPVGGIELQLAAIPAELDMFWYRGEGLLAVRAGANHEVITGAVAYGYRAPWTLWGPWDGTTRYMIGVRIVASATRSLADPAVWTMTLGLETEPIGALRYLLGIRSWY